MEREIRSATVELRAVFDEDQDEFSLEGVAAPYNSPTDIGGQFKEVIAPGAFERSLKTKADVRFLLNHNPDVVLGRTASGTLTLNDSPKGLRFRVQLDKDNQKHRDVYAMVKRGDISGCSFAFRVVPPNGDVWDEVEENGKKFLRRTLKDVDLLDASCVTYPQYSGPGDTSVAARAAALNAKSPAEIDAYNRARCAAIGREIEADSQRDLQRRIEAAGRAVAEDRRRGDIS